MEYSTLVISVIKGVIASIIVFIFDKIFVALEWGFNTSQILSIFYYVVIIVIVTFGIRSKTLKNYWFATMSFIVVSILIRVVMHDINNYIFSIIYGLDSEMVAGDGFMLMSIFISTMATCIVGLILALAFTIVHRSKKSKQ